MQVHDSPMVFVVRVWASQRTCIYHLGVRVLTTARHSALPFVTEDDSQSFKNP